MISDRIADLSFGLNPQALAVAQMLAGREPSFAYDWEEGKYDVWLATSPWYNGRERGVCFEMRHPKSIKHDSLFIVVYEHRNSDSLCALVWTEPTRMNPPTIESSGRLAYPSDNKWDVSHEVGYGRIGDMAQWVYAQMEKYYSECKSK